MAVGVFWARRGLLAALLLCLMVREISSQELLWGPQFWRWQLLGLSPLGGRNKQEFGFKWCPIREPQSWLLWRRRLRQLGCWWCNMLWRWAAGQPTGKQGPCSIEFIGGLVFRPPSWLPPSAALFAPPPRLSRPCALLLHYESPLPPPFVSLATICVRVKISASSYLLESEPNELRQISEQN